MVFHITHKHSPESCPAGDATLTRNTWGKLYEAADEYGVTIHSSWVEAEAHTVYLIVETDSAEAISGMLRPVMKIGTANISPVTDARAVIADFSKDEAA